MCFKIIDFLIFLSGAKHLAKISSDLVFGICVKATDNVEINIICLIWGLSDVSPRDLFGTNRKSKSILRIFVCYRKKKRQKENKTTAKRLPKWGRREWLGGCQLLLPQLIRRGSPHSGACASRLFGWQIKLIDKNVARFLHVANVRGMPQARVALLLLLVFVIYVK